jgi:tRNA A-37 threonylcarbamoyl transferase component Bud32
MVSRYKCLDTVTLSRLTQDAAILEQDRYGIKVLRLGSGTMLKIFRVKSWFSSAVFRPYSWRFFRNAQRLSRLGVPTVTPLALYRLSERGKTAVEYQPLPGITVRQVLAEGQRPALAVELGRFVAGLHAKGVYFRSLHLGNIILTPDERLGLIDVADTRFYTSPLSHRQRLRNFKHLRRLQQDRTMLDTLGWQDFCEGYWSAEEVLPRDAENLRTRMCDLVG